MHQFLLAVLAYVMLRILVRQRLYSLIVRARECAKQMEALTHTHGHTVYDLEKAGVNDLYDALWDKGGYLYRAAVPYAAFLCYWPIGPLLLKSKFLKAYDEVGMAKGRMGSWDTWLDVRRGYAKNTKYYPHKHLLGYINALKVALNIL